MPRDGSPSRAAIEAIGPVSRETHARLDALVALVLKWQKAENLVAPSTLGDIWTRHVADSAQLVRLFPRARNWLDLGSGGGFPGLVVAILMQAGPEPGKVHLVESNVRKCAFLRTAAREIGVPAVIHQGRIEAALTPWREPTDVITARALASLDQLLAFTAHLIAPETPAAFLKGVDYRAELDKASQTWDLDLVVHDSLIGEGAVILEIRRAVKKAEIRTSRP
ncbi:MAG: 16S rRNA (guanine(527)-N(7))-methyltransferase RsmG [Bauldia sp.]|nr:16S rRNA (guanine(527)-N(7))-methyltransferase RsmG [Bauldia sp.]